MYKANGSLSLHLCTRLLALLLTMLLAGCTEGPWNNPYPAAESGRNIVYSSFSERPKHLDPVRAYSANEYAFIAQIYEPPLQYHFLKRPYQLVPLAAKQMPQPAYFDAQGRSLPDDVEAGRIAYSEYEIAIRPGMRYQPHPAFAVDDQGRYRYHQLEPAYIGSVNTLTDFPETGSREVTAEDFIYQIKRLAFPRLNAPIAGIMEEYIIGFGEFAEQTRTAYDALQKQTGETPWLDLRPFDLEGVKRLGRYRLRIRLKGKYPQFLYWLAMPFFAPMPWEAERFYQQPGMARRNISLDWYPVGSGPFMLGENNPNLRMVLEVNPNYYGETYPAAGEPGDRDAGLLADAGRIMPFIEKAIYSLEKESIPYWNKFLQGYYDTSGISSDSFDQAVQFSTQGELALTDAMREKGIKLQTAVTASVFYMGFNMLDPVVGGDSQRARLLRQAISIAMDFEEYISIFNNGRGVAAQGPIPPGIFGNDGGIEGVNPYVYQVNDGKVKRKPIAFARKLLVEAGYPGGRDAASGKPLILYYDTASAGPDGKARLSWMRKQFAKLGIQLVIRSSDYNRFQEKMRKGTGQIFMWGWNADYPDPENFLFLLYGPNGKVEEGGENAANYRNREFDRLFVQMKNMENGPQRLLIIDRMVKILRRDAPWVWGFFPKSFSLYHAWYRNVKPNLMANNTLKYRRVDPAMRERLRREWNPAIVWPLLLGLTLLIVSAIPALLVYRRRERGTAR